jgi:hypothetical protein
MGGLDKSLIKAVPANEMGFIASRPRYSVLRSEKGIKLPALDEALQLFLKRPDLPNKVDALLSNLVVGEQIHACI